MVDEERMERICAERQMEDFSFLGYERLFSICKSPQSIRSFSYHYSFDVEILSSIVENAISIKGEKSSTADQGLNFLPFE